MGGWDSYADDLDALKSELENLVDARNDVMRRINTAEDDQQMMQPKNEVQLWLSRVQAVETDVDELIQHASEEIDKVQPGGFCSRTFNMSSNYSELEDMVTDKLQAVMNLIDKGSAFLVADEVGVLTTSKDEGADEVADTEMIPEDVADELTIVGLESLFDEIWKCLQLQEEEEEDHDDEDDEDGEDGEDGDENDEYVNDDEEEGGGGEGRGEVGIVGVYGMGGVGRTTLLKKIYNKLLDSQNKFGVVIWVSVSRDLRLEKIQEQIGIKIGLFDKVWRKKSLKDKAPDIVENVKLFLETP